MPVDLSSDCDCPNCLEGTQSEFDSNFCSNKRVNGSRSRKQSMPSFNMRCLPTQLCSSGLESDSKESGFLPSEQENSVVFSKKQSFNLSPKDIKRKIRPLKELTIQELLREFGDTGKFQPNSMSLGHFRDRVVMKFRRALYYSGVWVTHVRGRKLENHFSANYFKRNPSSLHRLVPWLKRELTAVYGDYGYTVKNILAAILHHMTKYDLDSDSFIQLLEPYLQQHTHHFLHEFISFVQSPYNMETYDQRAMYYCPSESPWVKKKPIPSAPILPLPEDHALMISQHETKQSKNTQDQWNEEKPQSDLKHFPNGNSSLKKSKIPLAHHETARKIHVWTKEKPESDNCKGMVSTNNSLLNWTTPRERGPGTLNCKKKAQEKNIVGIKLFPGQIQDQKSETNACTFSTPVISDLEQPRKYNLREGRVLSLGQQTNFQKKEEEKNKYSESSPKIFQRSPTERASVNHKSSCTSENTLPPMRDGRRPSSFRQKKVRCKQPSSFVEVGSPTSRRPQRRSRSSTHRSKSWCVGPRKRSISRDSSTPSLGGSHRSEPFTQNIYCEPSRERNIHYCKLNYERIPLTPGQFAKFSSTAGKRPNCPCKVEGASLTGSHHSSPTCLQIEKHRSPSRQEMKPKSFPRASRTKALRYGNDNCQRMNRQTPEEFSNLLGDLDDIKQMSNLLNVHLPAESKSKQTRSPL